MEKETNQQESIDALEDFFPVNQLLYGFRETFVTHEVVFLDTNVFQLPSALVAPHIHHSGDSHTVRNIFLGHNGRPNIAYSLGYLSLLELALQEYRHWTVPRGVWKELESLREHVHEEWQRLKSGAAEYSKSPELHLLGPDYLATLDKLVDDARGKIWKFGTVTRRALDAVRELDEQLELQQWRRKTDRSSRYHPHTDADLVALAIGACKERPSIWKVAVLSNDTDIRHILYAVSTSLLKLRYGNTPTTEERAKNNLLLALGGSIKTLAMRTNGHFGIQYSTAHPYERPDDELFRRTFSCGVPLERIQQHTRQSLASFAESPRTVAA